MDKKKIEELYFSGDYDEEPDEYIYDDYAEIIDDDIYADHDDIDADIYAALGIDVVPDERSDPEFHKRPRTMKNGSHRSVFDDPEPEPEIISKPKPKAVQPAAEVPSEQKKQEASDIPEKAETEEAPAKSEDNETPYITDKAEAPETPEPEKPAERPDTSYNNTVTEAFDLSVEPGTPVISEEPKGDSSKKLTVPPHVMEIIALLKDHTYTSYLVGDCVNMLILGERVMDFDIACNASIDRIIAIFEDRFKVREELLDRGELIIINGAMGISVAPYRSRIDGNGRPVYCKTIEEDLHRRTFTSEAVAYNPDAGIYDIYDGLDCITAEKTVLRAIDEEIYEKLEIEQMTAKKKSKEPPKKIVIEALKDNPESILIAMQKYARGEAEVSPFTMKNINDNAELLDQIMPSEIAKYFRRIILGRRITETLLNFREVIFHIFPVLREEFGFDQKSEYQEYTLYEHTAKAVGYAYPDYAVRFAVLLHDVGKPDCCADRGTYNTYYGHSERGVMLARDVFENYEADRGVIDRVLFMIGHHDEHVTPENVVEYTEYYGMEFTRLLLLLQSANIRAKSADPVNERVSSTLRQLADNIATLGGRAPAQTRTTATFDGLRSITDLFHRI